LVAVITGKKPEDIEGMEKPHNTNITTFEIDAKKNYKIPLFNCKKHLD